MDSIRHCESPPLGVALMPRGFFDVKADPGKVQPDQWSLVEREVRRFRKSHKPARAA
jgi:hypothetical protein